MGLIGELASILLDSLMDEAQRSCKDISKKIKNDTRYRPEMGDPYSDMADRIQNYKDESKRQEMERRMRDNGREREEVEIDDEWE